MSQKENCTQVTFGKVFLTVKKSHKKMWGYNDICSCSSHLVILKGQDKSQYGIELQIIKNGRIWILADIVDH